MRRRPRTMPTIFLELLIVLGIVLLVAALYLPSMAPVPLWKGKPVDHWGLEVTLSATADGRRQAADELIAAARDRADRIRRRAVAAMGEAVRRINDGAKGAEELPRLLDALTSALATDTDADVRAAAAEALGQARPAPTAALAALQKAREDQARKVRDRAIAALENQRKQGVTPAGP